MTEEIKTTEETTTTTTAPVANEPKKENADKRRGGRGEVGNHNIKGLFHSFQRREKRKSKGISLKKFAHDTAETGTDEEKIICLDWIKNKSGALEKKQRAERQKNRGATIKATALATKQTKHGGKK